MWTYLGLAWGGKQRNGMTARQIIPGFCELPCRLRKNRKTTAHKENKLNFVVPWAKKNNKNIAVCFFLWGGALVSKVACCLLCKAQGGPRISLCFTGVFFPI